MASQLKNIVHFTAGGPTSLPHNLNNADQPLVPDLIELSADLPAGVTVTADATNVILSASVTIDVLVESWHTIEREFGDKAITDLTPQPFVVNGGGGSSDVAIGLNFVYRPGATGADDPGGNVYTNSGPGRMWSDLAAAVFATRHLGQRTIEFDSSAAPITPDFPWTECRIPPGSWHVITNVRWTSTVRDGDTGVVFGDGVFFEKDVDLTALGNNPLALLISGYGLQIRTDRTNPLLRAPFSDPEIVCDGMNVTFGEGNDPTTLPMFEISSPNSFGEFIFTGAVVKGGLGNGFAGNYKGALAAPLFDLKGGFCYVGMAAGVIRNNAFIDSVGGGFMFVDAITDNFRGDPFNEFDFPGLSGSAIQFANTVNHSRYRLDPSFLGSPVTASPTGTGDSLTIPSAGVVQLFDAGAAFTTAIPDPSGAKFPIVIAGAANPANNGVFIVLSVIDDNNLTYANMAGVAEAMFPGTWTVAYPASYNELVYADSSNGDVLIAAPAAPQGVVERFTVVKVSDDENSVTVVSPYADTIKSDTVVDPDGSKTWNSNPAKVWYLTAVVA